MLKFEEQSEDIEKELEEKSIEREPKAPESLSVEIKEVVEEEPQTNLVEPEPQPEPPPKKGKTKRVRSQKQIEAFEKARAKRAEAIAARKKLKEEQKEQIKEQKKQIKEAISKQPPAKQQESVPQEVSIPKPVVNTPASIPNPREQVIQNHYYYYGVPPPNHDEYTKPKKKKKSKRPPTPTSSESESEEEYIEPQPSILKQEQQYYEIPKPTYKFSYA